MRAREGKERHNDVDGSGWTFHVSIHSTGYPLGRQLGNQTCFQQDKQVNDAAWSTSVSKRRSGCIKFQHIYMSYAIQSWIAMVLAPKGRGIMSFNLSCMLALIVEHLT